MKPGRNGIERLRVALCAAAIGALTSRAGAVTPDVVIDCPALSIEQRASLEARARAELALNQPSESEIHVTCLLPLAVVTYRANGVPVRSSSAPLAQDIDQWVEEILALIHAVIAPPVGLGNPDTPPAGVSSEPASSTINAPSMAPTPKSSPALATRDSAQAPRGGEWRAVSVGGGLCTELWAKPVNALIGPCASVGVRVSSLLRIAATGATEWSAAKPDNIALHLWQAGAEARFGRAYWLALGIQESAIRLVPDTGFSPRSRFAYEPTLVLSGGLTTSLAGQHLVAGGGIRSYEAARDVRLVRPSNTSVFKLPMLALTLGIEYEFDL